MSSSLFSLSNNTLSISGFTLLTQVPSNLTLSSSSSACKSSQAPLHLFLEAQSQPLNGCFLGFSQTNQAHLLKNPLGHFTSIPFLSIFRFKIWMSSMWVGSKASEIQPETQWVLFHLHELNLYAILVPLIEGPFRSALHPGPDDRVWIWAESGSTRVRASGFKAIAYVHVGDNPFNVMNEAFASVRVHLDTCRLLEEKTVPPVVERFGWCTWDAFYLSVEPKGIWYGVKEFYDNGLRVRFLVIDDGWQSIEFDDGSEEKLILGGQQMLGRLCRFEECEKFRKYRAGSLLDPNPPEFDPIRLKNVISKALEKEDLEKEHDKAIKAKDKLGLDLASVKARVEGLKIELDQMYTEEEDDEFKIIEENDKQCACKFGLRAFTKDLRTKFPDLEDIYVWQALCGAWGGVKPKATGFNSEVVDAKLSEGLYGTMDDLAANKMVESGIGLVSPNQAEEFYDAMHSYLSESGLTGVKVDDMHATTFGFTIQTGTQQVPIGYKEFT
ncbi:uncharacterized protein A4U43_C08F25800 [Asparagus officinalis]|nr:uncharacterized protein A4U43_C08F25800 [Asparagus officinalis]